MSDHHEWPLLLRTGYGNVFRTGRWTHEAIVLIATALNSGEESAWEQVAIWAKGEDWDEAAS